MKTVCGGKGAGFHRCSQEQHHFLIFQNLPSPCLLDDFFSRFSVYLGFLKLTEFFDERFQIVGVGVHYSAVMHILRKHKTSVAMEPKRQCTGLPCLQVPNWGQKIKTHREKAPVALSHVSDSTSITKNQQPESRGPGSRLQPP